MSCQLCRTILGYQLLDHAISPKDAVIIIIDQILTVYTTYV